MEIIQKPSLLTKQILNPETSRQPRYYTPVVLNVFTILSALAASFFYRQLLDEKSGIALLFASVTVFLMLTLYNAMLAKDGAKRFLLLVAQGISLAAFFYDQPLNIVALAVIATIAFFTLGTLRGRRVLNNNLTIRFLRIGRVTLASAVSGLVLAIIILYVPRVGSQGMFISRDIFQLFFESGARFTRNLYPGIDLGGPIGSVARQIAELQAKNDASFARLSGAEQEAVLEKASDELVGRMGETLKLALTGEERASDVFYNGIALFTANAGETLKQQLFIGSIILAYLVLRAAAVGFYWIVLMIAWGVYQLLIATNIFHIASESRSQEVLEY
ncbi:MAG: hypothetical protein HY435_00370 [Candidatus Liptonbacteria bacterium]|nr:hypothetical protein [Candidatus Liptonbacteria bacterium]